MQLSTKYESGTTTARPTSSSGSMPESIKAQDRSSMNYQE